MARVAAEAASVVALAAEAEAALAALAAASAVLAEDLGVDRGAAPVAPLAVPRAPRHPGLSLHLGHTERDGALIPAMKEGPPSPATPRS